MCKENYFVGVRFDNDKQLFHKLNEDPLPNSEIVRRSLHLYFDPKETIRETQSDPFGRDLIVSLNNHIGFLQSQIEFLHKQNAFLSLPWYKKVIYRLEGKRE
jgi:hypothetical protein